MTLKISPMRWLVSFIGVQFLCGIAWVLGPLMPFMEPVAVRLVLVLLMLIVWAAGNLVLDILRARQEQALTLGLTGAAADEASAVSERLSQALALLRQSTAAKGKKGRARRASVQEQPWYAIIGPPGAGKTTALMNAGLEFPLAGALGPGAVAGVGGTRLCEWWFTNDAVLIDTAGRYTTQDSNQAVDRAGWQAFLSLLRKTRPKQPLNGVLVAISLDDVASAAGGAGPDHAAAIRNRIDELDKTLGVRLPVYALLTKADLLAGFSEFFDDLDQAGRAQVWGTTFPLESPGGLGTMFAPLLERLNRRLYRRLDSEADPERRAAVSGFPAQLASVAPPVQAFLERTFAPDAAGRVPLLRGVYLTSGTQEGTPIDRLTGGLARAFGVDQRRAARLRPESGRAYFLKDLLRDVIFPEAPLVAFRPAAARRRRALRMAGFAVCALLGLGGSALLLTGAFAAAGTVEGARIALANQAKLAEPIPLDPVADADVAQLLPWLDAASSETAHSTVADRLGLSQDDKLAAGRASAYRNALNFALLPRLIWRAEERMRGTMGQPDALYEATRIYLMLGGAGPLDRASILDWFAADWSSSLPGEAAAATRTALARHLAALLDGPLPPVPLDGPLVAQARSVIGRVPLALRAYARLKPLADEKGVAAWRPSEALGPAGVRVFIRKSGTGLEVGIPGLYTIDGLQKAILPALPHAVQEAAAESWVMGSAIGSTAAQLTALEADVLRLYATEYGAAWEAMLNDLEVAPLRSLTQAAQDLFVLASPRSPVRTLLGSAAAQLAPGAALPPGPLHDRMAVIDDRFRPLAALFGTGGAAPIDQAMRPLTDLQQQLAKQAATTTKATPGAGEDPALALRSEALRQPQPLARWLTSIATGGAALRDGGPRGAMIVAWNATGGPGTLCPAVIADHYPFVPAAAADASLEDFTRLFGPGGAIDAFFNSQLKPYVDMGAKPWKLQAVDSVNAPLTAGDLAQFQRAATIRDLFFQGGSAQPSVRFDLLPGPVDPQGGGARLEIGNAALVSARDTPPRPLALTWPGRPQIGAAKLTATGATAPPVETGGPWALFRLIGQAKATPAGDKVALLFTLGDRQARFELRATPNPFTSTVLAEFRCPAVQ